MCEGLKYKVDEEDLIWSFNPINDLNEIWNANDYKNVLRNFASYMIVTKYLLLIQFRMVVSVSLSALQFMIQTKRRVYFAKCIILYMHVSRMACNINSLNYVDNFKVPNYS